ncbi:MAG: 50S ribosome-binding GTPase, partial [Treponema sp.]|nr:50S ribosome-binding GTPase [Treponema sp.]
MGIKIALAGNPNSGKTTLFNALAGANQFVGNWPGVTVEKKEGRLKGHKDIQVIDLPGIYSLSPYSLEEVISRNYLLEEKPDVIINIIDGTNMERNLFLTTQLLEMGIPVVVAVNMIDEVERSGDRIDFTKLETALGCPVAAISALKGTGVQQMAEKAVAAAEQGKTPKNIVTFSPAIEEGIAAISAQIGSVKPSERRYYAIKLLERDEKIIQNLPLPAVEGIVKKIEETGGDAPESLISEERYRFIGSLISGCYH